ncbi:hypothetical protein LMG28688_05217 [Paraburkholderia caffeinitolerans]|uniref:Uncharacterized protein n=2 Tax=Paraburkholderia caffeinitolerans TaxID=1723730 RepID=A0A6J5GJL7_9BURK|nr:hypothetical protein LMG28688_05217 [Paraburkholderia caffeinitolerans]
MHKSFNVDEIRALADESEINRQFFDRLANRSKNSRVTTVDHVVRFTRGSRREVVDLFRAMTELGLGEFVLGRKGAPSRFEWQARLTEVGQAAIGEADEVELVEADELEDDADADELDMAEVEMLPHFYVLRPGLSPVHFSLPSDLTQQEAERLATFIRTLPFGS